MTHIGLPAESIGINQLEAPCLCLDVDLSKEIRGIRRDEIARTGAKCAWILVRSGGRPIGKTLLRVDPGGLSGEDLEVLLLRDLRNTLESESQDLSSTLDASSAPAGPTGTMRMTAVVCTHDNPLGLERCLRSLAKQRHPNFGVLVVDNAPTSEGSRDVVKRFSDLADYVVEPRKGLSRARNRALEKIDGGIAAWIDDDEVADPFWLSEIEGAFCEVSCALAVSGMMAPAELETWPQVWFEQYGGHTKLRGFESVVLGPAATAPYHPLYPLPAFGTGGNMAMRIEAFDLIGPFDPALGAGSPALGAEDTLAFTKILETGGTVVYQPAALTFHFHRRSLGELRRQMFGYGSGLTAYYTSLLLTRPSRIGGLMKLLPRAFRDLFGQDSQRSGHLPADFPAQLLRANRRGLVEGPFRYLQGRFEGR